MWQLYWPNHIPPSTLVLKTPLPPYLVELCHAEVEPCLAVLPKFLCNLATITYMINVQDPIHAKGTCHHGLKFEYLHNYCSFFFKIPNTPSFKQSLFSFYIKTIDFKGQNERILFCLLSRVLMLVRIFTKYYNHPAPINKVMADWTR